jgi:phospholipid/cholesterol/gamma-HCH transport system permease protein
MPNVGGGRPHPLCRGPTGWLEELGLAWLTLVACLGLYLGILAGRERLDLPAFAAALRQIGLSVLPAITLVALALGLILGNQAESVFQELDLPRLPVVTLGIAVVQELVPILVGILVAGRAGVALAVRQAGLIVSGEMEGLIVSGLDPIRFTLGPVLVAMLLMSFALTVWMGLVTCLSLGAWLWGRTGVPPAVFLDALRQSLGVADLVEALAKPLLFAILIALIASVCGLGAGRDPDGLGRAATRTMIGAVTAILLTDLIFVLLR